MFLNAFRHVLDITPTESTNMMQKKMSSSCAVGIDFFSCYLQISSQHFFVGYSPKALNTYEMFNIGTAMDNSCLTAINVEKMGA